MNVLWCEKLHVCKKQLYQDILSTSNLCFRLKYESSIHDNAFSSENVALPEWGEKSAQIKHHLQALNISKLICWWIVMWEDNRRWKWRKCYYGLIFWTEVMISSLNTLMMDLFLNWWTGVVWITCDFISCLDSHSDGTHSLQRIHWWARGTMLNFSKSIQQTPLHLQQVRKLSANPFQQTKRHVKSALIS